MSDAATETTEATEPGPVTITETPIRLEYRYTPGDAPTPFLRGTTERKLLGRRCSECEKVYMPPRGVCSMCGAPFTDEIVEIADTGTMATYAVINVNFAQRAIDLPYIAGEILWDGSDITSQFLVMGVKPEDARMGMRVKARWKEGDDLAPTLGNIEYVEPLDEPDAPFEVYKDYV